MIRAFCCAFMIFVKLSALEINAATQSVPCPPIRVVATFSVLADLIQCIGGDCVQVQTIVPCDADPHTYEPVPNDAKACAYAHIVFINGLGFEGWINRLIEASGYRGRIIEAACLVQPRYLTVQGEVSTDPHAWHNVKNALLYVRVIAQALKDHLPKTTHQAIDERASRLKKQLEDLDLWVKSQIAVIPPPQRVVVTTHDAFWYYGQAYGITFLSPVGISTEANPSAKAVADLIQQIRIQNIKAVFVENLSNPRLIDQIATEAEVAVDGTLFADSLSQKTGPAPSYVAMIRHNTLEIIRALS